MAERNASTLDRDKGSDLKVAVNSIQRTLLVERLYVNIHYPANRIIPYDRDNLYPNKVKSIAQRSGTTSSAINKLAEFIVGEGFLGMDLKVNREGASLWDILCHLAYSKAMFKGVALHFNYNMFGDITEINPINFEFVRWAKDLEHFIVNPDWHRRNRWHEEITYNPFNPANVPTEIQQAGGLDKYKGQLFYWIPAISDWYTICNWDSVLDDAQFEAEAKLYALSSIQNDYSLSGLITYPKNLTTEEEIDYVKANLKDDTGAAKAGGVRVLSAMPTENFNSNWKWFTPMSRNNIDNLHKNQIETAKFNIYAAFNQPPILNGVATQGMFNEASFADAFNYYNSATETERKIIEKIMSKVLSYSVWPVNEVKIEPKKYVTREVKPVVQNPM